MKITDKGIQAIRENKRLRNRLAFELDKSPATIHRLISENEANGDLTKAKFLQIISEETGLVDTELLEEERAAI